MANMEQVYEALRKAHAAGNEENARRLAEYIRQSSGSQPEDTSGLQYEDADPDNPIDADFLRSDPDWIAASRIVYRKNKGQDFDGTDEEAADYGIDTMGWFNYNLPAMGMDAASLQSASQAEKEAFLYLMDAYDDLGLSWGGTWRFAKGVVTDPSTYVGLSSFGFGTAAAQGGKAVTKAGIRELVKAGTRAGAVAGVEGAIYGATDQTIRQTIEIDAGRREGYDLGEIGVGAGIGAAGGTAIGGAVGAGGRALARTPKPKTGIEAAEDLLSGTGDVTGRAAPGDTEADPQSGLQSFSGDLSLLHGFNGERPILVDDFDGERNYPGSVFGDTNRVYLDGNGRWTDAEGKLTGFEVDKAAQANVTFENALVVTPENIRQITESMGKKDFPDFPMREGRPIEEYDAELSAFTESLIKGEELSKWAEEQGYDGLIVTGFDDVMDNLTPVTDRSPNAEYDVASDRLAAEKGVSSDVFQDQVVAFKPSNVKLGDEVPKGTPVDVRTQLTQGDPAANQTASLLTDIVDTIRGFGKTGPEAVEDGVQRIRRLRQTTRGLADLLKKASDNGEDLSAFLTKMEVKASQMQVLKNAAQQATDAFKREIAEVNRKVQKATQATEVATLRKQADELDALMATVEEVDVQLSTQSGRDLRMRQEGLSTGDLRGTSVKSLMDEGMSRAAAEREFNRMVDLREGYLASAAEKAQLDADISRAIRSGDFAEASKLKHRKKSLMGRTDAQKTTDGSAMGKVVRGMNRILEGISEVMISMVFSPSTLIVNVVPSGVKMLYRPILDAIVKDPLSKAAYKEAAASYGAMATMVPSAFRAAVAAYRFERSFLLNDVNRVLEGGPVIPKKYGGGYLRFFPRLLQATDEFFSQVAYRGYGVGQATGSAYADGKAQGLSGKALDRYVRERTKTVSEKLFSKDPEKDENIISDLLDEALDRGMSPARADSWVKRQLQKNPAKFRRAEQGAGRDYVSDLLFKREFSGKSSASGLAKGYERFVRKHPIMRVAGQLFFRTPVRVFEEGIRLTPGLNMISPNFMADLAGKNGQRRQVRAQGEALMSYGIAGSIMTLYAQGSITSGGPSDYKQRRQGENTEDFEPYTITMPNGDKWSFRNMDPLATPLKIIVNALERYEMLEYRMSQGEHVSDSDLEMALAYVKVGTGAIAQALRDASLTQGIDQIMTGVELMVKEGDTSGQLIKYVGQKLQMFVPNTWYKAQMIENPLVSDPASIEQMLRQRINPQDPKVPKMYTALGRIRSLSNPEANLLVFSPSTPEERKRGIPEKELEVEQALWVLSQVGNTQFAAPYKHRLTGDLDLRTAYTKDGKETLYDRWMRITHESGMIDTLHRTLVDSDLPAGTPKSKGPRIEAARQILQTYRDAAMLRLMSQESGLKEAYIEQQVQKGQLRMGQRDNLRVPF